jgi:transposase
MAWRGSEMTKFPILPPDPLQPVLSAHYSQMLGLNKDWEVSKVDLRMEDRRLELTVKLSEGATSDCPQCGRGCPRHDHAPERQWQHLDAMGFKTIIRSAVPRSRCPEHGVQTVSVPWAAPHSRFTLAFEALALIVLQACSSVEAARLLLGLSWRGVQSIMQRAVERGLSRRSLEGLNAVGFDEKSYKRAQSYISHMCDLRSPRVLEVVEGRDQAAAQSLWQSLPEAISSRVLDATMDMSAGFAAAAKVEAPQARITYDKFHIVGHLNKAVDQTRREEHKELMAEGLEDLKGQRWLFITNPDNLSQRQSDDFRELLKINLRTGQAWAHKEIFSAFWEQPDKAAADRFLTKWCHAVHRSKLKALKKVAEMLVRHREGLLNYFVSRLTNALCEGFNSKIQQLKSAARGFRSFDNYRTRILFFLGKLDYSITPFRLSH